MLEKLNAKSRLSTALKLHPDILEYVISLNPHDFERLRNPLMVRLMPPRITLMRLSQMTGIPIDELIKRIYEIAEMPLTQAEISGLHENVSVVPTNPSQKPAWTENELAVIVDLLESDEKLDSDPMPPINRALHRATPGQVVLVKHKWDPQPLYDIWQMTGTAYYAEQQSPDEWWIYLRKHQTRG
jgi:hypothetical protein